jgi:hypothetical protein
LQHQNSSVYIITHPDSSFYYIGETSQLLFSRLHQHQYSAQNTHISSNSSFVHRYMRDHNISSFIILPITVYDSRTQTTNERKLLETQLIKQFNPKLNTQLTIIQLSTQSHRHRRRRCHARHQRKYSSRFRTSSTLSFPNTTTTTTNPITTYMTIIKGRQCTFLDLSDLLQQCLHYHHVTIHQLHGVINITNWKLVREIARKSKLLTIKNQIPVCSFISFTNFCSILKRSNNVQFTIILLKQAQFSITSKQISSLLRHRHALTYEFNHLPINHLLSLLLRSKCSFSTSQYIIIRCRIRNIILHRYCIKKLPLRITLKIPYIPLSITQQFKRMIRTLIHTLPFHYSINFYIYSIIQFVTTKSKNIKQLLTNHIKTAQNYTSNPPSCICSFLQTILHSPIEQINNHYAIRPYECISEIAQLINTNSMNIPIPTIQYIKTSLYSSLRSLYNQIHHLCHFIPPTLPIIDQLTNFIESVTIEFPTPSTIPTSNDIKNLQRILQYTIISTIDKNANQLLIICPSLYHFYLTTTFINDPHYKPSTINNENDYLSHTRIFYDSINGSQYAPFNYSGTFGYAYCIPKNKDLHKTRPIVSFINHPLKHIYKLISRTLQFLLNQLNNAVPHYILYKTNDLKSRLQTYTQSIEQQFSPATSIDFITFTSDIKNMYTELQHDSIMNSILWLIETCLSVQPRSSRFIIIEKQHHGIVHFYPSYMDDTDFIMFDITELIPIIVLFDLHNIHFTLGDSIILQQHVGAPMGGHMSAQYAICYCAMMESMFHSSLIQSSHIFSKRFMDDLITLIAIQLNSSSQRASALQHIQQLINNVYGKELQVEPTSSIDGTDRTLKYLDCMITINNETQHATIVLSPLLKNKQSIYESGTQTIVHFQHYDSFSPLQTKLGVIKSTVLRYYNCSNNDNSFIESMIHLQMELQTLSYPSSILIQTLQSLYNTKQLQCYQTSYQILQAIK